MMMRLPALTCFVLLGAGAQPMAPTPQFKVSMDLASALRAKDVGKVMALLADKAVIMPPGGDIRSGRREIEGALKDMLGKNTLELALGSMESAGSSILGFDAGTFEVTVKPLEGAAKKSRCKYLAVLTQDDEGHWRVAYLSWNSSELPAAAK